MIATSSQSRQLLGVNQQAYHALKASMSLDLRRQLLIAVCDNVVMQNDLADRLEQDLASDEKALKLARLVFDPEEGNLPQQVALWVCQTMLSEGDLPILQMVGIEQMTRQPAITQNYFLRSLEKIEALLPRLNTSLLIWVPWPWLRTIQQSSPTFWSWRNGVYEFVSDRTPAFAEPELLSLEFPPAEAVDQNNHQNGHTNGHQNGSKSGSHYALDISVNLYGEGANGQLADDSVLVEFEPIVELVNEPADEPVETLSETETIPLELLDDGLDDVALMQPSAFSTNALPAAAQPTSALKDLASLGGLRSIVSQGVNVTQAIDEDNAALFDAIVSDPDDLPEDPLLDEAVNAAEQIAAEFASLGWDEFPSGSNRVKERAITVQPAIPAHESQASQVTQVQTSQVQISQAKSAQSIASQPEIPLFDPTLRTLALSDESEELSAKDKSAPTKGALDLSPVRESAPLLESLVSQPHAVEEVKETETLAAEYFTTGLAYRNQIEAGDRTLSLIDSAIIAYENGLKHLATPHPDRITALNDLGTLYWLKAQQQPEQAQAAQYMCQSVALYEKALAVGRANEADGPLESNNGIVGQLYSNMGAVYTMLATCENPLENLTHAAQTYQRALPLVSLGSDPEEYATLQNSLGSVFWKLSHYDLAQSYLHQAISAYNESLLGYKPEQQPLDYAAVQNNLGITYWSLAKHERPEFLLKHAIAAYRDALNYRTSEVDPAACAISYNNLALAYWDLSKHTHSDFAQKSRYQKNAVTAFEAALNISKLSGALSQMDSAAIYHCLGDVHAQMVETAPSLIDVADSLQKSLYSYIQATEDLPTDSPAYPGRFGAIVANLRLHYDKLGLEGQQAALNRVPASLLPQVMMTL